MARNAMWYVWALILLAGAFACTCNGAQPGEKTGDTALETAKEKPPQPKGQEVTCPVCGLTFGDKEAVATFEHNGKTYYFLLEDHKKAFAADPAAFLQSK